MSYSVMPFSEISYTTDVPINCGASTTGIA